MSLRNNYAADLFSCLYIEEEVWEHPRTKAIVEQFPHAVKIPVSHYQDIFDRTHQDYRIQKDSRSLIIAAKHGTHIYHGAPVCQNFDEQYFYYCCTALNCIYDCSYCWLKGMYPTAHIVVFVNLEDYYADIRELLKQHPVYLCIAYETDLLPLESIIHQVQQWHAFAREEKNLTIELRTKCASISTFKNLTALDNFIIAYTLSPDPVIQELEKGTPPLVERIRAINWCIDHGYPVRLCFDPLLYVHGAKELYAQMAEMVVQQIDLSKVKDISIGTFRMSNKYLKNMRKRFPDSAVVQYPYETDEGYCHYPRQVIQEMEDALCNALLPYVDEKKMYREKEL